MVAKLAVKFSGRAAISSGGFFDGGEEAEMSHRPVCPYPGAPFLVPISAFYPGGVGSRLSAVGLILRVRRIGSHGST